MIKNRPPIAEMGVKSGKAQSEQMFSEVPSGALGWLRFAYSSRCCGFAEKG
jgi:hypothetical protein